MGLWSNWGFFRIFWVLRKLKFHGPYNGKKCNFPYSSWSLGKCLKALFESASKYPSLRSLSENVECKYCAFEQRDTSCEYIHDFNIPWYRQSFIQTSIYSALNVFHYSITAALNICIASFPSVAFFRHFPDWNWKNIPVSPIRKFEFFKKSWVLTEFPYKINIEQILKLFWTSVKIFFNFCNFL